MNNSILKSIALMIVMVCTGMCIPAAAKYPPVSYINKSAQKQIMMVDGKPFFYIGVQYSPHRLMENYNWSWADMEQIFSQAKYDGFTVIASPVKWKNIEPQKNNFNWISIEKPIDDAVKNNIKLEFLWFGSCTSTKSSEGAPAYVMSSYQSVLKADGTPVINNSDNAIKLDMADTNLLARERLVMKLMMNHIRSYITSQHYPNVVIGIQVQNEPTVVTNENNIKQTDRSYSDCANDKWQKGHYTSALKFNGDIQYNYLNGLSEAVKTSNYAVWTRCNWANEKGIAKEVIHHAQDNAAANYFDFAGYDAYTTNTDKIYNLVTDTTCWHYKNNLAVIMENAGNDENTDQLIFNAYAGNGCYHIFELTGSWNVNPQGMYHTNFGAKTIAPLPHVQKVRDLIAMLRKDASDLASKKASEGGTDVVFYNRKFALSNSTAIVGGKPVQFNTTNAGGIAIKRSSNTYVFLSTGTASFTFAARVKIRSLQCGYFNTSNTWVKQTDVTPTATNTGETFAIGKGECVRLVL
jgi:GH35 family endo-1,4-beta-xylanase